VPETTRGTDAERFGEEQVPTSTRERVLELAVTVLLGFAALLSAWCAYQSSRFGGEQTNAATRATFLRVESGKEASRAGQLEIVDGTAFGQYIAAVGQGNERLARFVRERFRDEFRPAFDAWLAQSPLTDLGAPETPFTLPEYKLAAQERADALAAAAEQRALDAEEANAIGDDYVLAVVLLASALFLLGIQTRLGDFWLRTALVAVAATLAVGTAAWIVTLPRSFG
jgi:hypothetical protein